MPPKRSRADFMQRLGQAPLLFDGSIGTQIEHSGAIPGSLFELLNLSNPGLIRSIHQQYRDAGATVLTANTFAANRPVLEAYDAVDQIEAANRAAVDLAREVAGDELLVAGAISEMPAPVDGSDSGAIRDAYREHFTFLRDAEVDLYVLESFASVDAVRMALGAVRDEDPETPVVAQIRLIPGNGTIDRAALVACLDEASRLGADVVGLNCGLSPAEMYPLLAAARRALPRVPLVAQPSVGGQQNVDGRLVQTTSPDAFATFAKRFLKLGVDVIGSCCGTSPEHTRAMAGAIRMSAAQRSEGRTVFPTERTSHESRTSVGSLPEAVVSPKERSRLGALLGPEFVVSVEVNPPASVSFGKAIGAARRLLEGGATVINTTDGARASLRMDNLAFASIMQRDLGCETILHVCGRDRNLLGTVSHLMAAHALGVRNLVLITGDPPKMGKFPNATPVYDVDSIGLLGIVRAMNAGVDPAGGAMDAPTAFLCGVGVEPAASDLGHEIDRLYRKKEAGADFVMTQPVYDEETMERFFSATSDLGLPVLMGVVPLASHRNAEFVHANIPGMAIPDRVRARMRKAGDGPEAREVGVAIAVESLLAARDRIAGAYIVPPLGLYSLASTIIDALRRDGIAVAGPNNVTDVRPSSG